jgi:hypothetical protein
MATKQRSVKLDAWFKLALIWDEAKLIAEAWRGTILLEG